jgi:phosphatidylethanolamine-binding protein (PEBP) family uncharacterized protein
VHGEPIPPRHSCEGEDVSPPLAWSGARRNDFGITGYRGSCPPRGHGRHRYSFRLYALDSDLGLRAGADKRDLERALEGHTLAVVELVGSYERGWAPSVGVWRKFFTPPTPSIAWVARTSSSICASLSS